MEIIVLPCLLWKEAGGEKGDICWVTLNSPPDFLTNIILEAEFKWGLQSTFFCLNRKKKKSNREPFSGAFIQDVLRCGAQKSFNRLAFIPSLSSGKQEIKKMTKRRSASIYSVLPWDGCLTHLEIPQALGWRTEWNTLTWLFISVSYHWLHISFLSLYQVRTFMFKKTEEKLTILWCVY